MPLLTGGGGGAGREGLAGAGRAGPAGGVTCGMQPPSIAPPQTSATNRRMRVFLPLSCKTGGTRRQGLGARLDL
ncbi:hypothetical protein GCM10009075_33220 [Sphingomonas trueperi]